ncbi:Plasmodium exported protein, unknown function [Plasmodium vivax]|uniref:Pv-fam-d protein n=1 Tax=Plasmodium vivax TaxID=5855 RepID=A0A565A5A5_PLAVI|nr:Plasmodium exported protein, unknown function [Plasmodium vivax]
MNKLNLTFLTHIVALTFLTWISHRGNEENNLNIYLNIKCNKGSTWELRNDRLLTNDDTQSEIDQSSIKGNFKIHGSKNKLKAITGYSEIHEKLKKDTSNNMHTYIKNLEHGYPNKKGLKRLDCHYEKNLFNEMYKLDKIAEPMKSKISYFKKVILKRYSLRYFICTLVILFVTVSYICAILMVMVVV